MKTPIHFFAIAAALFVQGTGQAQTNAARNQPDNNIHLKVYYQSAALGDINMAISSLHYLVAGDPAKYGNWLDTLSTLYVQNSAYRQAFLLSDALLNTRGYTDLRMEVKAVSAKALQQPAQAIDAYGVLYNRTKDALYGFEQLQLQYGIRRLSETVATANSLIQRISEKDKSEVNMPKPDGKSVQKVSLKAAVYNVLGLAYLDLKDKTNAIAQFESALKETPEFELARNNLDAAKTMGDNSQSINK